MKLLEENKEKNLENAELKRELMNLKKKYGENESENFFSDPSVAGNGRRSSNNYGALGIAIFSLISLIMMTNINVKNNSNSVVLPSITNPKNDLSN